MTAAEPRKRNASSARRARHAARLAAVQALYQMELTGDDCESVAQQFIEHRFPEGETDTAWFGEIVRGVPRLQAEIDRAVQKSLSSDWPLKRVDSTLRAILRAGVYELVAQPKVPARVVMDEYIEIARAFFDDDKPGFVNAALDQIARRKRASEFGAQPPEDELGI